MKDVLQRVEPIEAKIKPPVGAEAAGVTPEGRQIYHMVRMRSTSKPKVDPVTGERVWRKQPISGEPLLPVREAVIYQDEEFFTLEDQGNGNVEKIPYHAPTVAELDLAERARKVAAMGGGALGEALVDAGIADPAELIASLKAQRPAAPAEPTSPAPITQPAAVGDLTEYPLPIGGGWYRLSNGQKLQGKEDDAIEAELAAQEARRIAAAQPEE